MILPNQTHSWLTFIYALPITFIVLTVFAKLWGRRWMRFITISALTWTIALSIHLTILIINPLNNLYLFYIIAAVFEVLIIFWYLRRKN